MVSVVSVYGGVTVCTLIILVLNDTNHCRHKKKKKDRRMVLKLRRITDALHTANCGSSTVGVRWDWDQKYWRWADISVGPGQGSGIRMVLLNYEHLSTEYEAHCKELTTLYRVVNDIMLNSWI